MTRKTKLKSILETQIFQSTNTAKLDKLSRDKWSGLKKIMGKRPFLVSFFDQGKKIFQARRSRVRSSFLIRQDLIRRLKINSGKLKTSQIKLFTNQQKIKILLEKTTGTINVFERRICVVLTRVRLFPSISQSLHALQRREILVNGRTVKNPNYLPSIDDIINVRGKARKILKDHRISYKYKTALVSLIAAVDCSMGSRRDRLKKFMSQSLISRETILHDFNGRFGKDPSFLRHLNCPLPPHVPTYLIANFTTLSVCMKSTITLNALSIHYKKLLPLTKLWAS